MAEIDWKLVANVCKFGSVVSGGLLAGCGLYVLVVEQPARMQHSKKTALDNWSRFYNKAFSAMVGFIENIYTYLLHAKVDKSGFVKKLQGPCSINR